MKAEQEAAAGVNDLRRHVLAGWHQGAEWMRTDPRTEPLRKRADFKYLLARMDELDPADATVKNPNATPEERLAARRTILAALEALARPLPPARYIRRNLAQARQDVGQELLAAGRIDEARAELDEAMAERQSLLAESPTDDTLRTDLAESRFSTGDLLAAVGRLNDAVAVWEKGLSALEAELATKPSSLPLQLAVADQQARIGFYYLSLGMWAEGLRCYRRAFEVHPPTRFIHWLRYALLLDEAEDHRGVADLVARRARASPQL